MNEFSNNLKQFIERLGISNLEFANRLIDHIKQSDLCPRKNLKAQSVYDWMNGTNPSRDYFQALCLYVLYREKGAQLNIEQVNFKALQAVKLDFASLTADQFCDKYLIAKDATPVSKFFIYALYSEAIAIENHPEAGAPLGMIGAYVVDYGPDGDAKVDWGRVYFKFSKTLVFRGAWSSSQYAASGKTVNFRFWMEENGSITQYLKGGYGGVVFLKTDKRKPFIGSTALAGQFYDLDDGRREYRGRIYAEQVGSLEQLDLKDGDQQCWNEFIQRARHP